MNTCKTCKHWENDSSFYKEGMGECVIADNEKGEGKLFWMEESYCEGLANGQTWYMVTRENFGCVAWEVKDETV